MRIRVIVHGKRADEGALRDAIADVRRAGHDVDVRVTWETGDAVALGREAVAAGVGTIAVAGGDGTLNEVARGLLDRPAQNRGLPTVGLVPLGTANDFARAAGIPIDAAGALQQVIAAPAIPVDVGRSGDRVFVNVATGGFGTEITVATPEELKSVLGPLAYLVTGAARFTGIEPVGARIAGPGLAWEGRFLALAIGNGRQAGGGMLLCPDAFVNDGLLDVAIVPAPEAGALASLGSLLAGGRDGIWRQAVTARVDSVEIDADGPISLNLDGEPTTGVWFRIEVVPAALRMHLPPDSPLLAGTGAHDGEDRRRSAAPGGSR